MFLEVQSTANGSSGSVEQSTKPVSNGNSISKHDSSHAENEPEGKYPTAFPACAFFMQTLKV